MVSVVRFPLTALLLGLLAACASPQPKVALDDQTAQELNTITIVRPPQELTLVVHNLGHPATAFGIIGGAIAASDEQDKSNRFSEAMIAQKFSARSALLSALERGLVQAGYKVEITDGEWVKADGKYTLQYDKLPKDRVVLVVSPRIVGYVTTSVVADYQPTMWVVATLLNKDHVEIYRGYHSTGWKSQFNGELWKFTAAKTAFPNFDALLGDPQKSASALRESADAISASIAADLRKGASPRTNDVAASATKMN